MVNWKSIQELELEGGYLQLTFLDLTFTFTLWKLGSHLLVGLRMELYSRSQEIELAVDSIFSMPLSSPRDNDRNGDHIRRIGHWNRLPRLAALCLHVHVFGGTRKSTGGCFPMRSDRRILVATFIYPVVVDFIVLVLAAYKLVIQSRSYHRSRLMKLLFNDGFIYFIIVFVINIPTAVISYLELNPILYILFAIPASIVTVIASSRAVRRLSNFSPEKPAIYMITSLGEIVRTRELSRISFARPQKDGPTDTPSVVASVPGDSNPSIVNSNVAEVKNRPHVHNDANV
ncbi:hypothetical protein NLI96_g3610 [Meripilus lineatus]|uniref:Uncharacterized protein n=1 Tax=Meripilus lineatus TaxID=2056292 RepID=A0AAD5VB88_9APHY|nr:hypothetical protein NLI96_g3610 [Physisporinus lineatus]